MHGSLMTDRRFWPLFWTQFLGAFNDNLFKNALVILVTFRAVSVGGLSPDQMVALAGAIFIAPFFLFSALAGQVSDKLDKAQVIRATKVAEVVIMALGAWGFVAGEVGLLLVVLFFMGSQSAVFGPSKYAILPAHLREEELVRGNALVEMGTYLAILLGTLAGGVSIALDRGELWTAGGVIVFAAAGWITSRYVPPAPSLAPDLVIDTNPFRPTAALVRRSAANPVVWRSILAISWFWTFGSIFLSTFPAYTKDVLGGNETVATLFLALFSVGIGVGSMLCERLSRERVELGLVPIGSFGMSVFVLDLWAVGQPWPVPDVPLTVLALLSSFTGLRIAFDLSMLALSGGLLIVPLYALIQLRAEPSETSRIIAGNNIVNAAFMVAGQIVLMGLYAVGLDVIDVLLVLFVVNTGVAVYIYTVVPEFMLRFAVWTLSVAVYRLRVTGHEHVPKDAACVLVGNHVSFIDWFVLSAAIKRPMRFVMHKDFVNLPVMRFLFRQARVIPIASAKEDPVMLEAAMAQIAAELRDGQVVCIFPEGQITRTGDLNPFRPGIERIVAAVPVPVVPFAIRGLWGSYFSRVDGSAMKRPFRRGMLSRIEVVLTDAVAPEAVSAAGLEATVRALVDGKGLH